MSIIKKSSGSTQGRHSGFLGKSADVMNFFGNQWDPKKRMVNTWLVVNLWLMVINYSYNMVNHYRSIILVGGFDPSEKYEFVNGKDYPTYCGKKCSKPPTSNHRLTSLVPYCGYSSKSPVFKRWLTPLLIAGWWCNFTILKNDGVRQWGWDDIP